jgi:RNA polymerase sigma factor (sigma-70 family)
MAQPELIPRLFRTEYRKIVSVLCTHFGFGQMAVAEDIASETFMAALQTWPMDGVPPGPVAWLYHVAKNKARNYLQREAVFTGKVAAEVKRGLALVEALAAGTGAGPEWEIDLSATNIEDSQLRMMFSVCHPSIPVEAQVGLSLRILCGFGIEEIADAFLTNKETINKRLYRAREKLREEGADIFQLNAAGIGERIDAVLTTIYLLFTEGYYSAPRDGVAPAGDSATEGMRRELCREAIRLCRMLMDNPLTDMPAANALLALMCFHASRLDARVGADGELVLYADQDVSRWDARLISEGAYYMRRSASGGLLTKYHLEANIAYWHCVKEDSSEKWEAVLQLYNHLLMLEYSPVAALNRTFALGKVKGKQAALEEALKLKLEGNPYYFALLGELWTGVDDDRAREAYRRAMELAKTEADREAMRRRYDFLALPRATL